MLSLDTPRAPTWKYGLLKRQDVQRYRLITGTSMPVGPYRISAPSICIDSIVAAGTPARWGGAAHKAEIPYVFDHIEDATAFEATDRVLKPRLWRALGWNLPRRGSNRNWFAALARLSEPQYELLEYGDEVRCLNADSPDIDFFAKAFEIMRVDDTTWRRRPRE